MIAICVQCETLIFPIKFIWQQLTCRIHRKHSTLEFIRKFIIFHHYLPARIIYQVWYSSWARLILFDYKYYLMNSSLAFVPKCQIFNQYRPFLPLSGRLFHAIVRVWTLRIWEIHFKPYIFFYSCVYTLFHFEYYLSLMF